MVNYREILCVQHPADVGGTAKMIKVCAAGRVTALFDYGRTLGPSESLSFARRANREKESPNHCIGNGEKMASLIISLGPRMSECLAVWRVSDIALCIVCRQRRNETLLDSVLMGCVRHSLKLNNHTLNIKCFPRIGNKLWYYVRFFLCVHFRFW